MNIRFLFYSLAMIFILIVAVAGWFATDYLGNDARQKIIGESQASVLTLSVYVSSTLTNIEGAVKAVAGSPWIAPALMSKRDQDIEHANSTLDRYNSALNASVSYLMDAGGMTLGEFCTIDTLILTDTKKHLQSWLTAQQLDPRACANMTDGL